MIDPATFDAFLARLRDLNVLVIGDLMLDRYLWGKVSRISPEAPVPVVDVDRSESRPGGAANVALNLAAMGAKVAVCGVTGNDDEGRLLMKRLVAAGFDTRLVTVDKDRPTTTKTRIIGNQQQILRVDREVRDSLPDALTKSMLTGIMGKLSEFDAVVFEDYDKGVLSEELIDTVVHWCADHNIPTVVDPKFRNFRHYQDVTLFKPNLKELNEALSLRIENGEFDAIAEAVRQFRTLMPHAMTLVTLSEHGVFGMEADGTHFHLPAHYRKITDVSGAGDTVIAMCTLALAAGLGLEDAAGLANLAGGLVCEEVGVVTVDRSGFEAEVRRLVED
ncbi:MAG: D-glycero-beta-D-manno-heptose-7-phosphate kinase [Bacteroidota bacterium]